MPSRQTPLARFKSVLKSSAQPAKKAAIITQLGPKLPSSAIALMDKEMDAVDPLVQVAMMDAYFEMTEDNYHRDDLERILKTAEKLGDAGEELYMAARLALGRVAQRSKDALGDWGDIGFEAAATRVRVRRKGRRRRRPTVRRPEIVERITVIVHGTWAADGKWWRPGGDFFEYVKTDLKRDDVYGKRDLFKWSGKNRDASRKKASASLDKWIRAHPSAEVNIFAHSHGANVAMLATHRGIRIDRLIMLSPPVRSDYFADWTKVGAAYNIQADHDPVVAIARGGKKFGLPAVTEKELKADGHSATHDPDVWKKEKVGDFVSLPAPAV